MNPKEHRLSELVAYIRCIMGENSKPFAKRLEHWSKHWRDLPQSGIPPALVDWLWVDLVPKEKEDLPMVFIPPWTDLDIAPRDEEE